MENTSNSLIKNRNNSSLKKFGLYNETLNKDKYKNLRCRTPLNQSRNKGLHKGRNYKLTTLDDPSKTLSNTQIISVAMALRSHRDKTTGGDGEYGGSPRDNI